MTLSIRSLVGLFKATWGGTKFTRKWSEKAVAEVPMDGNVDAAHIRLVEPIGETARFRVISVEDLIADRMGQYASGTVPDRREQARLLFALNPGVDRAYLDRRIREETAGDHGIEIIEGE